MWTGGHAQPGFVRLMLSATLRFHLRQLHRFQPGFVALWITVLGLQGCDPRMGPYWNDPGLT
jgi:hypothetical protein